MISLAQAIGSRREQQDAIDVYHHNDGVVAILADGMGGHAGGTEAALLTVEAVRHSLRRRRLNEPRKCYNAFSAALDAACTKVRRINGGHDKPPGSTLVIAIARHDFFAVMSVGDSYAWHVTDDGARPLVTAHEVLSGGLTSTVPDATDISFYVSHTVGGALVLASDGLTSPPSGLLRADALVQRQLNLQHANQDNVSVIVIQLPPDRVNFIPGPQILGGAP